jgi:hypothetical protein
MKRRVFLTGITAITATAFAGASAFAATFAEDVVGQLAKQGFSNIEVGSTWLGRLRITGLRGDGQREIILNPRTGEILRDTWLTAGTRAAKPIIDDVGDSSSGQSGGGEEDRSLSNDTRSGSGGDDSGNGNGDSGGNSGGDSGSNSGSSSGSNSGSGSGGDDSNSGGSDHSGSGKDDDRSGKDEKPEDKRDEKPEDKRDEKRDDKRDGKDDDKGQ